MSYKSIVVHVDTDKRSGARVDFAANLAIGMGAHLTGLHLVTLPRVPSYAQAEIGPEFLVEARRRQQVQVDALGKTFDDAMRRHGLVGSEWRAASGDPEELATLHARYADLLIVGQRNVDDDSASVSAGFAENVVFACGRPVLVVPYAGHFEPNFKRVLVAWKPSREATRAVTDSIPFLQRAEKVSVLSVNPKSSPFGHGEVPGADLALFLARHKVNAEAVAQPAVQIDVGDFILSRAADLSADLIVMGAYGHSRMREIVFGGVTRTISQHMTVPVLYSH